ncbi:MAG: redoxin domain-containing protein [Myxococcota bacterium]|jgi:thiol-disulfide isomerase/thioredoxin|nr:redoxin domain-containing protein [Myxococcota bacterium]
MAASKKQPQLSSQFTPTTMALMAMSLLVGIIVGYIVGTGTEGKGDGDEGTSTTTAQTSRANRGTASKDKASRAAGKSKSLPAKAAQSESPFLDEVAVDKFEGESSTLTDYRRVVDFVSRRNARAATPLLNRLATGATGTDYAEEIALLQAANKVNQNLPTEALDALGAWKTSYPDSRLIAQAGLWEGKAHVASARAKGGSGGGEQGAYDLARQSFEEVIDKYPENASACGEALFNLGSVYKSLGQPERSLEMYDKLVESYPTHSLAPRALYSVANGAWSNEDYDTATRYFQRLLDSYPDDGLSKRSRKNISAIGIIGGDAPELVVDHWLGGDTTLAANKGKVVMLSFWNEWCPHCKREMPKLQQLAEKYDDQGLVLISVTKHTKSQTDEKVQAFLDKNDITIPTAVEPSGYQSTRDYGVSGVPAGVIIGRDGKIAWRNHPARLTEERLQKFLGG